MRELDEEEEGENVFAAWVLWILSSVISDVVDLYI
jgi:hypothetical protein